MQSMNEKYYSTVHFGAFPACNCSIVIAQSRSSAEMTPDSVTNFDQRQLRII